MQQWQVLHKTQSFAEASIIQGVLEENNIPAILLNKQDSSYLNFGYVEVHVHFAMMDVAKQLLNKALLN